MDASAEKNRYSNSNKTAIDLVHRVWVAQHTQIRRGPQFRTEFSAFCRNNGIKREPSSTYNPESNGLAEAAVKNIKTLITRCHKLDENLQLAIAAWRNMARADGVSPSQLFFGRRQRQQLPLTAEPTKTQESSTAGRDATAGTLVTVWKKRAEGNSYIVCAKDGNTYIRGRRLLKPINLPQYTIASSESTATDPKTSDNISKKQSSKKKNNTCLLYTSPSPRD